ncbi:MAG TPA: hypothetical protein EYP56_10740 [Planctomycetaceae bacterium]|nr:hypothetical protein [Planctomycetaceae bacterium]
MKRLIVLAAVALLAATAVGCECCRWFRRGSLLPTTPTSVYCEPGATYSPSCDPCTTPPAIAPGAETYVPGPSS